jgi:hypothetical protein
VACRWYLWVAAGWEMEERQMKRGAKVVNNLVRGIEGKIGR